MAKETNVEKLCDRELLEKILSIVERQEKLPPPAHEGGHRLYDNKSLMEKLNIKEKYLKKLRDNGYLGYSREGDKYWYTQEDVDRFLRRFHYEAFAIGDELPFDHTYRQEEPLSLSSYNGTLPLQYIRLLLLSQKLYGQVKYQAFPTIHPLWGNQNILTDYLWFERFAGSFP